MSSLYQFPNNCTLFFNYNDFITNVTILNNQVVEFGVKGERKHKIEFSSYDEIRIINNYIRQFPSRILKIRNNN